MKGLLYRQALVTILFIRTHFLTPIHSRLYNKPNLQTLNIKNLCYKLCKILTGLKSEFCSVRYFLLLFFSWFRLFFFGILLCYSSQKVFGILFVCVFFPIIALALLCKDPFFVGYFLHTDFFNKWFIFFPN